MAPQFFSENNAKMYVFAEYFSHFLHNISPLNTCFFLGERKTDLLRFKWAIIFTMYYFFSSFYTICAFSHEMFLNNKIMTQALCCATQGLLIKGSNVKNHLVIDIEVNPFSKKFQNEIQWSNFCRLVKWLKGENCAL